LEEPDGRGIDYDSASQKALDRTIDEIKRRFGDKKATHAHALGSSRKPR